MATPAEDAFSAAIEEVAESAVSLYGEELVTALYPAWVEYICRLIRIRTEDPDLALEAEAYFRELTEPEQRALFPNSGQRFEEFVEVFALGRAKFVAWLDNRTEGSA